MAQAREKVIVEVEPRDGGGKNAARRLRASGRIPGNVYGLDRPPFKVAINPRRLDAVLKLESGENTVFSLALQGEERMREAMIKEIQRDPVTDLPLHVDFVRLDLSVKIEVEVAVRLLGTPVGVRMDGGILDFVHREVLVECLPGDIPEHLDVNVEELHVGQSIEVKDLPELSGVEIKDDPEQVLAVVNAPKAEEVVEVEGEGDEEPEADDKDEKKEGAEGDGDGDGDAS